MRRASTLLGFPGTFRLNATVPDHELAHRLGLVRREVVGITGQRLLPGGRCPGRQGSAMLILAERDSPPVPAGGGWSRRGRRLAGRGIDRRHRWEPWPAHGPLVPRLRPTMMSACSGILRRSSSEGRASSMVRPPVTYPA